MEPEQVAAPDLAEIKRLEVQRWDAAAPGWFTWFHAFEGGAQPLSDRMVERSRLRAGMRVLDVASGLGEPAVTAARRVGPSGYVLATDASPEMVEHARRRIAPLGLPQIEVRLMDAESPDLAAASFDAVLCRFGLMFMPSLDQALSSLGRLLRPGGRLAAAVWSTPERVPFLWIPQSTARRVLGLPPPPTSGQSPFDLADVAALVARLERAGYRQVEHERVPVVMRFADATEFVRFASGMSATLTKLLADHSPAIRDSVWNAVGEAAAGHANAGGEVVFENEAFCVVAEGPG